MGNKLVHSSTTQGAVDDLDRMFRRAVETVTEQRRAPHGVTKRAQKNRSGRQYRKSYNGQAALRRVGGRSTVNAAIYAPQELLYPRLEHDDDIMSPTYNPYVPARLCVVVNPDTIKNPTLSPNPVQPPALGRDRLEPRDTVARMVANRERRATEVANRK